MALFISLHVYMYRYIQVKAECDERFGYLTQTKLECFRTYVWLVCTDVREKKVPAIMPTAERPRELFRALLQL